MKTYYLEMSYLVPGTLQEVWGISSSNLNNKEGCCDPFLSQRRKLNFFFLVFKGVDFFLFIYLFLAALGLRCCARAFSNCGEQGLLFIAAHGLPIAVASLVAEHGL